MMKKLLMVCFLIHGMMLQGQNVGINTLSPEVDLDVRSVNDSDGAILRIANPANSRFLELFSGNTTFPDPTFLFPSNHNLLFASNQNGFTERMRIDHEGNVGLGITNPEAQLDIRGGDWNLDAGNPGDLRIGNSNHNFRIGVATGGGGAGISRLYSSSHLGLGSNNTVQVWIENTGDTGFGTTNPTQKVQIEGKLKIGNDDKAPSEGTIRYNSTTKRFEGYDGAKWINLGGSSPYGFEGTFSLPNEIIDIPLSYFSTSIEADGSFLAFSTIRDVFNGEFDYSTFPPVPIMAEESCVYVYLRESNGNWINTFTSCDTINEDDNYYIVEDFAINSNRLIIGYPSEQEVRSFTFDESQNLWFLDHTFFSPETTFNDRFGYSVAIHGEETIIGAPAGYSHPGKAYIYDENDALDATLIGSGSSAGDLYGFDVDISTNRAIVGSPGKNFGSIENAGAVNILNKFNGNWSSNSTWTDDTPEEDENYGDIVGLEESDYFYIQDNEGIDAFLIENGNWLLKETISGEGAGYLATYPRLQGSEKIVFYNENAALDQLNYLLVKERDENNFFQSISALITGRGDIVDFDITNNAIYVLGDDRKIYIYE